MAVLTTTDTTEATGLTASPTLNGMVRSVAIVGASSTLGARRRTLAMPNSDDFGVSGVLNDSQRRSL
jgi:hypothetical protein